MSKELIVSVNGREKKIAIIEDDVVTEFYVERGDENQGIVGNIYKGRVMKVLPGMQSAFVDIGLERDSFLYVSDFFDEEDLDESVAEEKKDSTRPPAKPERVRGGREAARTEPYAASEPDEEKDFELRVAALRHIEELSSEPVIEPSPDDESTEPVAVEGVVDFETRGKAADNTPRQRRQRRLRYSDRKPAEEQQEPVEAPLVEESVASDARASESEEPGGRRRRRRRRGGSSSDAESAISEREGRLLEINGDEGGDREYAPIIIVHHEPLERITDEDIEATEGEMLKDAMLQERIMERIQEEERRTSFLKVDPTPEVHVGSLHQNIGRATDFERISDDQQEQRDEREKASVRIDDIIGMLYRDQNNGGTEEGDIFEARTSDADRPFGGQSYEEQTEQTIETEDTEQTGQTGQAGKTGKTGKSGKTRRERALDADQSDGEQLEDASAEIRQRPDRGEFATRRGGRGRRRGFRPRTSVAEATAEVEEANGLQPVVQEPLPPPPLSRNSERFQRPVISDLLREGQEIIVQIAKEPIGQKGARITSHIALPGRYIVYMPTVEHIGVSRKIGTDEERQRLKRTLHQLRGESAAGGGFIVRTAANGCTIDELRAGHAVSHSDVELTSAAAPNAQSAGYRAPRPGSGAAHPARPAVVGLHRYPRR